MTFEEMLEQIEDANLKKNLAEEYKRVNREKGENGRKLIEKDSELDTLRKSTKETSEWSKYFKLLEKEGMEAKDIPALLDKMKVTKTLEDEHKLMSTLYKDAQDKLKEAEKENKGFKIKTVVDKHFAEIRKNFKNEKGEALTVLDDFIDTGKLYADISDLNNEVLLKERAETVLKDAFQKTEAIKQKFGFQGATTPTIPESQGGVGQTVGVAAQLKEITQKQGIVSGMDAYLAAKKG